jgi:hypothetical protein
VRIDRSRTEGRPEGRREERPEERLVDRAHPPGSAEEIAAAHLRSAVIRRPPGPAALARVRARLDASVGEPIPWRLRWKTSAALVLLSAGIGGVTGAAVSVAIPILKRTRPAPASTPVEPRVRRVRPRPMTSQSPSAAVPAPVEDPLLGPGPMPSPAPVGGVASAAPAPWIERGRVFKKVALAEPPAAPPIPPSSETPPETVIAQEARLLGRALQRLRRDHDPRAALTDLDDYAAQFPGSALGPEADLTRVDALLELDRRPAALAILDRLEIPTTTRGRELVVVRAELRVGATRYLEAIADFTRALADGGDDALSERALHGRVACYLAMGNGALARADLQDYLIRFRDGRFAGDVRRRLGEIDRRP